MGQRDLRIGWAPSEVQISRGVYARIEQPHADPLSRLHFCVVSEHGFIRNTIRQMFQSVGIWSTGEVHSFNGGIKAFRESGSHFDAIIVDCGQNGQGAKSFIRAVRCHEERSVRETPIIALIDGADADEIKKICKLGINAILRRPFSIQALMLRIRKVLVSTDDLTASEMAKDETYKISRTHEPDGTVPRAA